MANTKTQVGEYKGHDVLSIVGEGQKGKNYTIMGAGAAKWATVLKHIDEIRDFVEKAQKERAEADKTKTKPKKNIEIVI